MPPKVNVSGMMKCSMSINVAAMKPLIRQHMAIAIRDRGCRYGVILGQFFQPLCDQRNQVAVDFCHDFRNRLVQVACPNQGDPLGRSDLFSRNRSATLIVLVT